MRAETLQLQLFLRLPPLPRGLPVQTIPLPACNEGAQIPEPAGCREAPREAGR